MKIHGKSRGPIFLENCGVPECGKGERARRVAHCSFLPAVVQARGAERALQQWPHVLLSPLPIKTTQGVLLGAKQKVKGTRARRIECTRHKRCRDASTTCLPVPLHMLLLGILSSWSS